MWAKLRENSVRKAVAALYVVAMLALGFAHVAPAAAASGLVSPADGPKLVLCLSAASQKEQGAPERAHHDGHFCAACCLTAAPGAPPAPSSLSALDRSMGARLTIPENLGSAAKAAALAPQSRGPPVA